MNTDLARARIADRADLNAYISLTDESGEGSVVAVKDLIRVKGTVTTAGGKILPQVPDEEDAPVIASLRRFGAIVIGKANMHEFAYGPTNDNPHFGRARNPYDPSRTGGGSSGGSGVAVAAGLCDWAIGSDTGGSIRIPSAFCGIVGIKPSFGALSTEGVIPLSRSLDVVGPMAPDVETAARGLEMMGLPRPATPPRRGSLSDFRLAVPAGWDLGLDETVAEAWARVSQGVPAIPFPDHLRMVSTTDTVHKAEATAYHYGWLAEDPSRYGPDVLALLEAGFAITAVDYLRAQEDRAQLRAEVAEAMRDVDALLVPTVAIVAPHWGMQNARPVLARLTRPFSGTGQPVISVPVRSSGLPVGVQVVGHVGREWDLVEVARAFEQAWSPSPNSQVRTPQGA